jgi:hypothetical protein
MSEEQDLSTPKQQLKVTRESVELFVVDSLDHYPISFLVEHEEELMNGIKAHLGPCLRDREKKWRDKKAARMEWSERINVVSLSQVREEIAKILQNRVVKRSAINSLFRRHFDRYLDYAEQMGEYYMRHDRHDIGCKVLYFIELFDRKCSGLRNKAFCREFLERFDKTVHTVELEEKEQQQVTNKKRSRLSEEQQM